MENGNGNGNEIGNWRQQLKNVNLWLLTLVKTLGTTPEGSDYAQNQLGLDLDRFGLLMSLDPETMHLLADQGFLLFRPRLNDLDSFIKLCRKGNVDRAASLLAASVSAEVGGEGVEA
jgi:hypothetical protein